MCNKSKFDKRTAITVLNQCIKNHRPEKRIYFCDECNSWHLTSSEEYEPIIYLKEEELLFCDKWKELI